MTSIHRLPLDTERALKSGRAIAFLTDYRHPRLADHTFTVVGFLDTRAFESVLVPDEDPDCELVRCEMPVGPCFVSEVPFESADARAVHELWTSWVGGFHNDCLRLLDFLAHAREQARLIAALAAAEADGREKKGSRTARKPSGKVRKVKHARKEKRT